MAPFGRPFHSIFQTRGKPRIPVSLFRRERAKRSSVSISSALCCKYHLFTKDGRFVFFKKLNQNLFCRGRRIIDLTNVNSVCFTKKGNEEIFRSTLGDNGVEEVCACLETCFCNTRQSNARSWHLSILPKGSFTKVSPAWKDNPRTIPIL